MTGSILFLKNHSGSTLYVIRAMQIKIIMRYHYASTIWPRSKILTTPNAGRDVEQQGLSFLAGGNTKWYSHFRRRLAVSYKTKHTLTI